jgi:hypothetical protein
VVRRREALGVLLVQRAPLDASILISGASRSGKTIDTHDKRTIRHPTVTTDNSYMKQVALLNEEYPHKGPSLNKSSYPTMTSSPIKLLSKNASSNHLPLSMAPTSPQSTRTLRRLQSAQNLSSNSPSLITQQRQLQQHQLQTRSGHGQTPESIPLPHHPIAPSNPTEHPSRLRANSDLTASHMTGFTSSSQRPAPSRKGFSGESTGKRSSLEILLRDGPTGGNVDASLQELRYLILSSRVDADSDGMVR